MTDESRIEKILRILDQQVQSRTTIENVWTGIEISAFFCTTWPTSTPGGSERARDPSLRLTQCKILVLLANGAGVSQRRLAEISEIDPIRLIRILDWLEVVGWAERRSDPQDRKAHVLALTESAKPVLERAREMGRDTSTEALQGATKR